MADERQQAARAEQVNAAAKEATLLTLDEAAPILGISVRTLYDYARNGKIKAIKFANKWRITPAALKDVAASAAAQTASTSTSKPKKPRGKLAVLIRDFDELHALAVDCSARLAEHVAKIQDLYENAYIISDMQHYERLLAVAKASKDDADKMVDICQRVVTMLKGKAEK